MPQPQPRSKCELAEKLTAENVGEIIAKPTGENVGEIIAKPAGENKCSRGRSAVDSAVDSGAVGRSAVSRAVGRRGSRGSSVVSRAKVSETTRAGYGETCAKVILFGEHSVVYGHPAVALPLKNLKMRATVTGCKSSKNNENGANNADVTNNADSRITLTCLDFTGPLCEIPQRLYSVRTAIKAALEFAEWDGQALHITTKADFPPERGLGSSAAAAGAVIRAILDYYNIKAKEKQIFELTQTAERIAHGHPSGLDATATAASWPVRFQHGKFSRMDINMRAWIILADSGHKGMTRVTVEALRKYLKSQPETVSKLLEELGRLAAEAEYDLANGRAKNMGERMTRVHKILAELGVSTPQLDSLVRTACEHGALGAKLTGGGGGGCVIALAESAEDARKVSAALREAGAQNTWIVDISSGRE